MEELKEGTKFVHDHGKKIYVTVNIVLHNKEIKLVKNYLKELESIGVDAIIVSDPLIVDTALKETNLEVHLSTQQSTLNVEACKYWVSKGVKRIVLAREATKEEIKEIYSHIQAIEQCRKYIEKNFPNVHINHVSSTALAAEIVKDKENCACIANKSCINEYNLSLIEENVQDNDSNQTKFWVLSKIKNEMGKKMSIIFSCKDNPGALYQILRDF